MCLEPNQHQVSGAETGEVSRVGGTFFLQPAGMVAGLDSQALVGMAYKGMSRMAAGQAEAGSSGPVPGCSEKLSQRVRPGSDPVSDQCPR